jgi:hypothetical protein
VLRIATLGVLGLPSWRREFVRLGSAERVVKVIPTSGSHLHVRRERLLGAVSG